MLYKGEMLQGGYQANTATRKGLLKSTPLNTFLKRDTKQPIVPKEKNSKQIKITTGTMKKIAEWKGSYKKSWEQCKRYKYTHNFTTLSLSVRRTAFQIGLMHLFKTKA